MYQERQDEQRERKEIVIPVAFPVAGQEQADLVPVVWSMRAIASQHLALALILDLLVRQAQKQEAALELEHLRDKLRAFQGQAHSLPLPCSPSLGRRATGSGETTAAVLLRHRMGRPSSP